MCENGGWSYLENHFEDTSLIFEVSKRLSLSSVTIHSACSIYHCFHRKLHSCLPCCQKQWRPTDYNEVLASTSIYIASKIEEEPLKIRDVVNVCYRILHIHDPPLEIGEQYWCLRDSILSCEQFVLRVFQFRVSFDSPHKYLLSYLSSLSSWADLSEWSRAGVSQFAWNLLQDSFHLPICVEEKPSVLSLAILKLAVECTELKLSTEGVSQLWWQAFHPDVKKSTLEHIACKILQISEFESQSKSSRN
ncbi:cyclin-Q-like isoform X2 [Rhopilema esculentum]|uniref:cyclin-Q-like isoform X2 n=1 Tax=Rhopilema esculentum TaxID=499914 RepID=UPI0031CFDE5C